MSIHGYGDQNISAFEKMPLPQQTVWISGSSIVAGLVIGLIVGATLAAHHSGIGGPVDMSAIKTGFYTGLGIYATGCITALVILEVRKWLRDKADEDLQKAEKKLENDKL